MMVIIMSTRLKVVDINVSLNANMEFSMNMQA